MEGTEEKQSFSNKRIAKNTLLLYMRTLIVMAVMLYTSRIVLQALGVIDLGIYNVVGGIVMLMSFLQTAQSRATSRYITYELGKDSSVDSRKRVFSICMTIHIIIAIVILVLAESIGLWVVNHLTDIPSERMLAANIVYQFSVFTFIVNFVRVPYDAVIIAHEEMSIYAYLSILEAILQLCVAFCLLYISWDKLILYGILHWAVAFFLLSAYFIYIRRKYSYYRYEWIWDKTASFEILKFSGWTLLGSSTNTLTQQGVGLLLNNFVGLVANTALGFANQVNMAVNRFVQSFTTAFNPQVIKLYANDNSTSMFTLVIRASKFSFILCYAIVLPLIVNMDFLLGIWLGEVPEYTSAFCRLILICALFDATTGVLNTSITATGDVKLFQIGISISFLLDFATAFILLKSGFTPELVFGSRILTRGLLNMIIELYFIKKQLKFSLIKYLKGVIVPIVLTIAITLPIEFLFYDRFTGWPKLIMTTIVGILIIMICMFSIVMDTNERHKVVNFVKTKIHGIK